jgi:hypothetical protein
MKTWFARQGMSHSLSGRNSVGHAEPIWQSHPVGLVQVRKELSARPSPSQWLLHPALFNEQRLRNLNLRPTVMRQARRLPGDYKQARHARWRLLSLVPPVAMDQGSISS